MKTKIRLFLALSVAILCFSLISCAQSVTASGDVVKQERELSGFTGIKVKQGIDVYLKTGPSDQVVVEIHENLQDILRTEVRGGTLEIYLEQGVRRARTLDVFVTLAKLDHIKASSGSDVESLEMLNVEELSIETSGGSDVELEVTASSIELETSGGADAHLSGKTGKLKAEASGGSDIKARNLEAESVWVRASGGADASVYATGELDMEASGGSDINYRGGAKVVHMKASGSADINKQ